MIDGMKPEMAIARADIINLAMLPIITEALEVGRCGSVCHTDLKSNTEALRSCFGVAVPALTHIFCSICPGYVQHAQTELCAGTKALGARAAITPGARAFSSTRERA